MRPCSALAAPHSPWRWPRDDAGREMQLAGSGPGSSPTVPCARGRPALQDTHHLCCRCTQVAPCEPQVFRKERHGGQTFVVIYWLHSRPRICDVDTDCIHLLALSKILFYSLMEKAINIQMKESH